MAARALWLRFLRHLLSEDCRTLHAARGRTRAWLCRIHHWQCSLVGAPLYSERRRIGPSRAGKLPSLDERVQGGGQGMRKPARPHNSTHCSVLLRHSYASSLRHMGHGNKLGTLSMSVQQPATCGWRRCRIGSSTPAGAFTPPATSRAFFVTAAPRLGSEPTQQQLGGWASKRRKPPSPSSLQAFAALQLAHRTQARRGAGRGI